MKKPDTIYITPEIAHAYCHEGGGALYEETSLYLMAKALKQSGFASLEDWGGEPLQWTPKTMRTFDEMLMDCPVGLLSVYADGVLRLSTTQIERMIDAAAAVDLPETWHLCHWGVPITNNQRERLNNLWNEFSAALEGI